MPIRLHGVAPVGWMGALGALPGIPGGALFGNVCGAGALGCGGVCLGMALAVGARSAVGARRASDEEEDDPMISMGARPPICLGIFSTGARLPIFVPGSKI